MLAIARHPTIPAYAITPQSAVIDPGTTTPGVDDDAETLTTTSATVRTGATINPGILANVRYASMDPGIATVGLADGVVARVTNGTARIIASAGPNRQLLQVPVSQSVSTAATILAAWVIGSLARHCTDNVGNRIAGKTTAAGTLDIFSAANHAAASYTRSPEVWCADYHTALTGCAVWNSSLGQQRAQTAITPRHVIGAAHYGMTIGETLRFITADNEVIERTVTHTRTIPGTDSRISLLSSAMPSTIRPVRVLPTGIGTKLANIQFGVPCLLRNQYGEARIADWNSMADGKNTFAPQTAMPTSRRDWHRLLVVGDSGGPALLMVAGELVAVTTWHTAQYGPALQAIDWSAQIAAIDSAAGVSTGLVPAVINLTGFPTYQP